MKFISFNKLKIKKAISFFWAFPLLLIWRYSFFIHGYKLIKIRSDRVGHFVPEGAEQLIKYKLEKNPKSLYCFDQIISNFQWAKMISRKLPVYKFLYYVHFWSFKIFNNQTFVFNCSQTDSRDIHLLFDKFDARINFTNEENKLALSWLKKFGFQSGEKFICLLVRDDEYLNKHHSSIDWSYHSYRNSDIESYREAIKWLISKDYWVIRMGKLSSKEIKIDSDKFIDFSFSNNKSDLIDIWLFANCNGCITTGTGPDSIPHIYGIPCLGINWLPVMNIHSFRDIITYPKYLYDSNNNLLDLSEILRSNYYNSEDFIRNKIRIEPLSSSQILNSFKEFYAYKLKNNKIDEDYQIKNSKFWIEVLKIDKNNKFHKEIHKKSLISKEWINAHL